MQFFWGIVTGYTYCRSSASPQYLPDLPDRVIGLGQFWPQMTSAMMLLAATITLIVCTRHKTETKNYVLGTVVSIAVTLAAGLILAKTIRPWDELNGLPSAYTFGLGIYINGYVIAILALLVNLSARVARREIRILRHASITFFAFLTFNWTFFTTALVFCH